MPRQGRIYIKEGQERQPVQLRHDQQRQQISDQREPDHLKQQRPAQATHRATQDLLRIDTPHPQRPQRDTEIHEIDPSDQDREQSHQRQESGRLHIATLRDKPLRHP